MTSRRPKPGTRLQRDVLLRTVAGLRSFDMTANFHLAGRSLASAGVIEISARGSPWLAVFTSWPRASRTSLSYFRSSPSQLAGAAPVCRILCDTPPKRRPATDSGHLHELLDQPRMMVPGARFLREELAGRGRQPSITAFCRRLSAALLTSLTRPGHATERLVTRQTTSPNGSQALVLICRGRSTGPSAAALTHRHEVTGGDAYCGPTEVFHLVSCGD
jgi:hypothetical protein